MTIQYTMLMHGGKPYFEKAIDPLFECYQPILDQVGWTQSPEKMQSSEALFVDKRVKNDAGFVANLVVGVVFFVSGWSVTKLLDHFFKDKLTAQADKLANKLIKTLSLKDDHSIEIRHIVWLEDIDLAIIVRLAINNKSNLSEDVRLLPQVHKNSIDWVGQYGKQAPVHSYLIKDGTVNIKPSLYTSINDMDNAEGTDKIQKKIKEFRFSTEDMLHLNTKINNKIPN